MLATVIVEEVVAEKAKAKEEAKVAGAILPLWTGQCWHYLFLCLSLSCLSS